ncbi:sensor domain-containing diguanylate cyclase [Alkalibacterium kapii]|uniref:Diguanylate cyclase n=1 Tax=Alkalibacterium kapii TaxID=426704 RepID=A0A511AQN7_9LACT|nr:diguanylate cyclase [Alkalibacterium kapii]GEK90499.1 diguanylate cyclase [Alkalibacterium kapii]
MSDENQEREIRRLRNELEAVKRLNKELLNLQEQQDSLEFSWIGNLGHWFWDFKENKVSFNPKKAEALGFKKEDLPEFVDFQFFTNRLHPEDYEHVMKVMKDHLSGKIPVWEVKYRIQAKDGSYKTYYDRGTVTQRSISGEPLFLSGIVFDITNYEAEKAELEKANKEWAQLSKLDKLTGLFNRTNILVKLGQILSEVNKHSRQTVSLIILDIDNLEHQNALFGPLFGDEVIKAAAKAIKDTLNPDFPAGTFEGGKFLIILPDVKKNEAKKIAETIHGKLKSHKFSEPAEVTISSGVAEYRENETVSQIFNRADRLLSKVKENGKNDVSSD